MSEIEIRESKLPGVGVQHDFSLDTGQRIGVITHHSGRRDLLIFDLDDPDLCRIALQLSELEGRILGQLMGASQVVQSMAEVQQTIGGLSIDWIPIGQQWACSGATIESIGLYKTGTNIIAVVRNQQTIPAPPPDFELEAGDTVVVVGKPEGIRDTIEVMQGE